MNPGEFQTWRFMRVKHKISLGLMMLMTTCTLMQADSNLFKFQNSGFGIPTFTSRSAGTRILFKDTLASNAVDDAIGVGPNEMWYSVTSTASSSHRHLFYAGATPIMVLRTLGGVPAIGINQGAPTYTLDVYPQDAKVGTSSLIQGALYLGAANYGMKRQYRNGNDVGFYTQGADLYLSSNSNTPNTQFVLKNNGNIGIGTDTPSEKLQVIGNVSANNLYAGGNLQWQLIDLDTFNNTADGWTSNLSGTIWQTHSMNGTTLLGRYMLGGYNKFGSGHYAQKSFPLPTTYTEVRIRFKLYLIDSWGDPAEYFKIHLATNGGASNSNLIYYEKREFANEPVPNTVLIYRSTQGYGELALPYGIGWEDLVLDIDIVIPKSSLDALSISGSLPVYLTSTLDEGATNESWGISEFEAYVR